MTLVGIAIVNLKNLNQELCWKNSGLHCGPFIHLIMVSDEEDGFVLSE